MYKQNIKMPRWFHFASEKSAKYEMERILVNLNNVSDNFTSHNTGSLLNIVFIVLS